MIEELASLRKEDVSNDIHPFEVLYIFVLQRRIHHHLQQCLSVGVGDFCFLPMNKLILKVKGICGLLATRTPKKRISKEA